jgi:hypothetical protein
VAKRPGAKFVASLRGLTGEEYALSLGPLLSSCLSDGGQGSDGVRRGWGRRARCRQCLLKGCQRWFRPTRPQARYCSVGCREAARRWRRWQASRRYRGRAQGQERRRQQSRRYRARQRERPRLAEVPLAEASPAEASSAEGPPSAAQLTCTEPDGAGEGQRAASDPEKSDGVPCDRPGCYTLFHVTSRSPTQRFCSRSCRQALRRVRQREARGRARRRRLAQRRAATGRAPPHGKH